MIINTLNDVWLDTSDHHLSRIRKVDKLFVDELDFQDIKLPVKIEDVLKTEKKRILSGLVFLVMKIK